jgi:hypothetical protein
MARGKRDFIAWLVGASWVKAGDVCRSAGSVGGDGGEIAAIAACACASMSSHAPNGTPQASDDTTKEKFHGFRLLD